MSRTIRTAALSAIPAALASLAFAGPAQAAVSGPAFWIDGELYRTVATPTDLSGTGAPDSSYDAIYSFSGNQRNVVRGLFRHAKAKVFAKTLAGPAASTIDYCTHCVSSFESRPTLPPSCFIVGASSGPQYFCLLDFRLIRS